jgi:hypothetical protein
MRENRPYGSEGGEGDSFPTLSNPTASAFQRNKLSLSAGQADRIAQCYKVSHKVHPCCPFLRADALSWRKGALLSHIAFVR